MVGTHEGGCLCGAVRYVANGEPAAALVCHCRFCQVRTGSAFATMGYFRLEDVAIRGTLTMYEHRSDETGRWLRIEFCPTCGTPITHTVEARPGMRGMSVGTFDAPKGFRPQRQIWMRSKHDWVELPADLEQFPQSSTSPTPPRR